jgi:predicted NBD/HSP70 family sugar kinase
VNILVIDVGGTNVKILASGEQEMRKIPSGKQMTPALMARSVKARSRDWKYDRISIGLPAPVVHGQLMQDPVNLGPGWVGYDLEKRFGMPVKIINDAAMQALGSYEGGTMLFLGLGTGLGSALIVDNVIAPMELAHLPYRNNQTFEDYVGQRGLDRFGKQRWRRYVDDVVAKLRAALVVDYVVLGGGNAKKLKTLPEHCRLGDNTNAFIGGFRLWKK